MTSVPMHRTLSSTWFPVMTALCCGVASLFTSWLAVDSSAGVRVLAAFIGAAVGLLLMLLVAWALEEEASAPTPVAPVEAQPVPVPAAGALPAPGVLAACLEEGRALAGSVEPGAADARVGAWIDRTRRLLEQRKPGVLGYFDALATRPYADDAERLDAHTRRLQTIVRDFS